MPQTMRTPLSKVRGHGAGHSGTGNFITQRVSAAALLILAPWFVVNVAMSMPDPGLVAALDFLANPINAVGVILLLIATLVHMRIGMQEIVEDYIHRPITKAALLTFNTLLVIVLGVGATFALLQIN